jgi:ABC-2 type transport system ATP-binding protein
MSMTPIIEIRNLRKQYPARSGASEGNLAVRGLNLSVAEGEIFSLLGPNGAGKSTTINMMSGLIAPSEGDVFIGGHSVSKAPLAVKAMIGVVPQEIALYPELSARQNLKFFGKLYGLRGAALDKRCDEVLDFIGLSNRQRDRIDTFSGGMKRRVNIGVGLLQKPRLVFMDEPTVGVDPQSRRIILDVVKTLNSEGMSVLYTTHYMEEAEEISHRIGIIDHGELIAIGSKGDLIEATGQKDAIIIKVAASSEAALAVVQGVEGVEQATLDGERIRAFAARGRKTLPLVMRALDAAQMPLLSVEVVEPNLETIFLHLTGRALRD